MPRLHRLWLCLFSLVLAIGFCIGTGLVPRWGQWYSNYLAYRNQTDAFLDGSLSLETDPGRLTWDLAWSGGGVQQVWGLGVPIWRLPFECIARAFGQPAFPDRLAFAVAFALIAYALVRLLMASTDGSPQGFRKRLPGAIVGVLILLLFPPFVTICRTWFLVYEEVQAYAYLCGIGLFIATVAFLRQPTLGRYAALGFASGLIGFVRPTMLAYGFASLLLAWLHTRRKRWRHWKSLVGVGIFCLAGAMLFATNLHRFDSGLEFGHGLNLNGFDAMRYASRFDHPYRTEPLPSASRELFSTLFLTRPIALFGEGYKSGLFAAQSSTFRWRDLYFSTYDITYFVMILGGLCWSGWACWRFRRNGQNQSDHLAASTVGAWCLVATLPLLCFYLRFPFISSRYLLDFGPAFAVAVWSFSMGLNEAVPSRFRARFKTVHVICALFLTWCGYQVVTAKCTDLASRPRTITRDELMEIQKDVPVFGPVPSEYSVPMMFRRYGFGLNGAGWNSQSGQTKSAVMLLIRDPQRLELELVPTAGAEVSESDWDSISAKIGLEDLELNRSEQIADGRRMIFNGPRNDRYQSGFQVVFIGFMRPEELSEAENSKFRLLHVRWRTNNSGG